MLGLDWLIAQPFKGTDLVVLAVTTSEPSEAADTRARLKVSYGFLVRAWHVWEAYGADCPPLAVIIDRSGVVRYRSATPIADDKAPDGTNRRAAILRQLLAP